MNRLLFPTRSLLLLALGLAVHAATPPAASASAPRQFLVRDFGAVADGVADSGDAIRAAIAAARDSGGPAEVLLAAGTYRVRPAAPGQPCFPILQATNLVVRGVGNATRVVITDPAVSGFVLGLGQEVSVRDLVLDYDPAPFCQGTIRAVDREAGSFDLEVADGFSTPDADNFLKAVEPYGKWGMAMDPATRRIRSGTPDHFMTPRWEPVSGRTWRFFTADEHHRRNLAHLRVGDAYVHLARGHGTAVFAQGCRGVRIEGVTIHASPGLAVGLVGNEGAIEVRGLTVRFATGTKRLLTTNADGVHGQQNRSGPIIEDCHFEGMADDAINFYAPPNVLIEVRSPNQWLVSPQTPPRAGDRFQVLDPRTGRLRGEVRAAEVRVESGRFLLTLEKPLEGVVAGTDHRTADTLYNLDACGAGFVIRRNHMDGHRRYGCLLRAGTGVVEDNVFADTTGAGVVLANEPDWPEGPVPWGITIRRNRFLRGGTCLGYADSPHGAALALRAARLGHGLAEAEGIRDVLIEDNEFVDRAGNAILLGAAANITLRDNWSTVTTSNGTIRTAPVMLVERSSGVRMNDTPGATGPASGTGRTAAPAATATGIPPATGEPAALALSEDPSRQVRVNAGGRTFLVSPPEGLWSVATNWHDGWPSGWVHARPEKVGQSGDWTVVEGAMPLTGGVLQVRDAYRLESGLVRGTRRWTWTGKQPLPRATLSVRWLVPGATNARPMLPGVVVYGNPAGEKTGNHAVIVHAGRPGDRTFCEEHRLAAPWTSLEWAADGAVRAVAMHTLPSPVAGAHQNDQWWTLGVVSGADATELASMSGPTAANGRGAVTKALQGKFLEYPDTWLELRPGAVMEKTFWIEVVPTTTAGSGFRQPLRTALRLQPWDSFAGLPGYAEILREKHRFALSRWRDRDPDAGFEMYPDYVPGTQYVMGWCGQADAAAYAMLVLGGRLGDPEAWSRGRRALDWLSGSPFNAQGFLLNYDADTGRWKDQDPVSQGQAMESFARAIAFARSGPGIETGRWEAFLQRACAVQAARILDPGWTPRNTAEAFFISPLGRAGRLFGNDQFRQAAVKAGAYYAQRHLDLREPYWGGTLDAACEDKEGAWAAFQGFLALYELGLEPRALDWAAHAMDVMLSYTVLWDLDLPAGRLRDHGLKTRGWTIVSAQNQHLDVFGVMATPEIWRMGEHLHRNDLKRLAALMFRSCGQLMDPYGSSGEQIQHTNFAQHGDMSNVFRLRGGYSESWTVFWITAHFLNAAAEFERMGVDLDFPGEPPAQR